MDAQAKTVREILYSGNQYLIPFFQRNYSWNRANWKRLRDDLWALRHDGDQALHFLGPLVCTPMKNMPGEIPGYQLIDGQQRLTTLTVLLAALRDAAREIGVDELAEEIQEDYLLHKRKKGSQRYKVIPRLGDREALCAIVENFDASPFQELKIVRAWQYYRQEIRRAAAENAPVVLRQLFQAATAQLSLVVITIDGENPYEIFESLNSTGLPLEESDLIRNFMFMQIPITAQEEFHKSHWQALEDMLDEADISATIFYRDYLMREGAYSKAKQTFVDFKEQNRRRALSPEFQINELKRFVKFERWLHQPVSCPEQEIRQRLAEIQRLDVTTAHPLLLNLLGRYEAGTLALPALVECLDDLASFVLRRSVCGESTRSYNRWFTEAISAIGDSPCDDLKTCWLKRGWPDDKTFVCRMVEFALYRREPKKCQLILERLEAAHGHKEHVDLSNITIEHVMPQTIGHGKSGKAWQAMLGERWPDVHEALLHTLGNLTLSGYNTPLGNKPYEEKRDILSKSKLSLNAWFASVKTWDEAAIRERGQCLAQRACQIWPRPARGEYTLPPDAGGALLTKEQRQDRYRQYWSGLLALLSEQSTFAALPKPTPDSRISFRLCGQAFRLRAFVKPHEHTIGVAVVCRGPERKNHFAALRDHRLEVEEQLREPLQWLEDPGQKTSLIMLFRPESSLDAFATWPEQHAWLAEKAGLLLAAFAERCGLLLPTAPTSRYALRQAFWTELLERSSQLTELHAGVSPSKYHWIAAGAGLAGLGYNYVARQHEASVELYIDRGKAKAVETKAIFDTLYKKKPDIEAAFGEPLTWERLDKKRACRIVRRFTTGGYRDHRSVWPALQEELIGAMVRLEAALAPHLKAIKSSL